MAIFASRIFDFIQYIGVLSDRNILVAFAAGNILVFSIQLKSGGVMIKSRDFPLIRRVAFQAICLSVGFELAEMCILMAGCTGNSQTREYLDIFPALSFLKWHALQVCFECAADRLNFVLEWSKVTAPQRDSLWQLPHPGSS
jgi:hypothetical protein